MANPYEIRPLGGLDLGGGIAQLGDRYRQSQDIKQQKQMQQAQMQQMQAEKLRKQEARQAASAAYQSGDMNAVFEIMSNNPDIAEAMQKSISFVSDVTRKKSAETAIKGLIQLGRGGSIDPLIDNHAEFVESEGGDPKDTLETKSLKTPEEKKRALEAQLIASDSGMWKQWQEYNAKPEAKKWEQGTGDMSGRGFNPITGLYSEDQRPASTGTDEIPSEILAQVPDDQKPAAAAAYKAAGGGEKGLNAANKLADRGIKAQDKEVAKIKAAESMIEQAEVINSLVSRIRNADGFSSAVGAKGISSGFGLFDKPWGGSAAADVVTDLGTLEAKNFLTSIKVFKDAGGAGSLSDSEGKKLAAAITSLDRDQSETNLRRNLEVIEKLTAKMMADANNTLGRSGGQAIDDIGRLGTQDLSDDDLLNKYRGR